jgi:hypothetical protein
LWIASALLPGATETAGPVPTFANRQICVLPLQLATKAVRARRIAFLRGLRTCRVRRESLISASVPSVCGLRSVLLRNAPPHTAAMLTNASFDAIRRPRRFVSCAAAMPKRKGTSRTASASKARAAAGSQGPRPDDADDDESNEDGQRMDRTVGTAVGSAEVAVEATHRREVAVDAQERPVTVRVDNLAALDLLTLCGCHWSDGAAPLSCSLSQRRSASHLPLACSHTTVMNMDRNGFELRVRPMDAPMPLVASDPHGRTGRWSV